MQLCVDVSCRLSMWVTRGQVNSLGISASMARYTYRHELDRGLLVGSLPVRRDADSPLPA
jgi:hypothetical protein